MFSDGYAHKHQAEGLRGVAEVLLHRVGSVAEALLHRVAGSRHDDALNTLTPAILGRFGDLEECGGS